MATDYSGYATVLNMPIIDITLLTGRDDATKRRLMREVTELVVQRLEVPHASVRVLLREVEPSHYAVGGVPKDELDAGGD
jgi:4-oxalocrotonate tautomerase